MSDPASPRWKPAPLLPREDGRDRSLIFVVAVLTFLACLTLIAALAAGRAADGWRGQLTASATVIVRPRAAETPDAAAARAAETLAGVSGVAMAQALEKDKAEALLAPWLDKDLLADLPVPRLVAVDLDPRAPASAAAMDRALKSAGVDATVDDHAIWIKDIVRAGRTARLAAFAVAALIAAAAAAVIAFATSAALNGHRDLVEVLHLAGAEDRFIAGLFQVRFARLAAFAGLCGAVAAVLIAALARLAGGGGGLTPVLPIDWIDLIAPLPAPVAAALVAATASRLTAFAMLRSLR